MTEKTSFVFNTLPPGYGFMVDGMANTVGWECANDSRDGFTHDWEICESAWDDFVDKVVWSSGHPYDCVECGLEESVQVGDLELHCVENQSARVLLDDGYGLSAQLYKTEPYRPVEHRAEMLARFAGFVLGLYGMPALTPKVEAISAQPSLDGSIPSA